MENLRRKVYSTVLFSAQNKEKTVTRGNKLKKETGIDPLVASRLKVRTQNSKPLKNCMAEFQGFFSGTKFFRSLFSILKLKFGSLRWHNW